MNLPVQQRARIKITKPRKRFSPHRPRLIQAAAADVARADHQIVLRDGPQEFEQFLRRMGKIGVHLHDPLRAEFERPLESIEIGRAQTQFSTAVQEKYFAGMLRGHRFHQVTGPVRTVVIYDQ